MKLYGSKYAGIRPIKSPLLKVEIKKKHACIKVMLITNFMNGLDMCLTVFSFAMTMIDGTKEITSRMMFDPADSSNDSV